MVTLCPPEHLSPSEADGDMLGYDLYSSALADILSEPTMQPPICVGLYAQWGSGKSFLLKKLEGKRYTGSDAIQGCCLGVQCPEPLIVTLLGTVL